jgi:TPR repeat protein
MLAFLFAQAGFHRNVQVASASTTASVPHAEAVPATPKLAPTSSPVSPLANSPTHHHITDPEARADVENMTRYEIATVRRAAQYGDDVAAFQLGMAYEIGYGMTQNCQKAAEWVTRAANDGNPAAEYNLGLRYRDGDGVAANSTEAEKWLKKAAERKYGNASALLASVSQGN